MVVFGQSFFIQAMWLNSVKVVVFGQSVCSRVISLYFGKNGCIRAKWLYSGKSVCIRAKVVAVGHK